MHWLKFRGLIFSSWRFWAASGYSEAWIVAWRRLNTTPMFDGREPHCCRHCSGPNLWSWISSATWLAFAACDLSPVRGRFCYSLLSDGKPFFDCVIGIALLNHGFLFHGYCSMLFSCIWTFHYGHIYITQLDLLGKHRNPILLNQACSLRVHLCIRYILMLGAGIEYTTSIAKYNIFLLSNRERWPIFHLVIIIGASFTYKIEILAVLSYSIYAFINHSHWLIWASIISM